MKNKGVFFTAILTAVLCISGNLLAYSGGTGEPNNPYQIANVTDFNQLSTTPTDWNKSFILTADINLTGLTFTQTPIAPDTDSVTLGFQGTQFIGIFDGNDHIISNLTINAPTKDYVGLFGGVGSGGQIKNLGVVDVNITGNYYVGGLVGSNTGTLTSCYATGSVSGNWYVGGLVGYNGGIGGVLTSCYATGSVSGTNNVGGLVGSNNYGTLTACYATGPVTGYSIVGGLVGANEGSSSVVTACYATGSVTGTGGDYVGGLAGKNYGILTDCNATGPVTAPVTGTARYDVGGLVGWNDGTMTDCYATGAVNGADYVGGLVGENNYGTVTNCYATGSVSGNWDVGGLGGHQELSGTTIYCFWDTQTCLPATVGFGGGGGTYYWVTGKTTAEMKTLSTFTSAGWDFVSPWGIFEHQAYPYLRTQPSADLNSNGVVDFKDFAIFGNQWLEGT